MMVRVVLDFLATLDGARRDRVLMAFDSPERFDWSYIPRRRKGLALKEMTAGQQVAARGMLRAALSEKGYRRCDEIMHLEPLVAEMEGDPVTYDPGNYVFSVFGRPGPVEPWGWRLDGHHLSLNFVHTPDGVSAAPLFYGANPATVEHGPKKGLRVLGGEEDLGRQLIRGLDHPGRDIATIRDRPFQDILTGPGRELSLREPEGLELGGMAGAQRNLALAIVEEFLATLLPEVAAAEHARLREAGIDGIRFAWAGGLEPRQPHYYRLHGPTLLIEYDNTQNQANHIHSVWHDRRREFGADLLAEHYRHSHHKG